jgi:hypothetical protein
LTPKHPEARKAKRNATQDDGLSNKSSSFKRFSNKKATVLTVAYANTGQPPNTRYAAV